jgi:hypothetical protein
MRIILILLFIAATASSALAENDRALMQRVEKRLRSEWDRQDCMWRETLRLSRSNGGLLEDPKKAAETVAYACSRDIRAQILENMTAATEMGQHEMVGYDQLAAQQRALSIGRQLDELGKADQPNAPH